MKIKQKIKQLLESLDWYDSWWFAGLRKYGTKNLESLGNSDSLNLDGEIMEIKKKKYKLVEQK